MGLSHVIMYEIKMAELDKGDYDWNEPLDLPQINKKSDDDFIYF